MANEDHVSELCHINGMTPPQVAMFLQLADAAADKAVRRFATEMGIPLDPIQSQQANVLLRSLAKDENLGADLLYLRRARERSEGIAGKIILTFVGLCVVGTAAAVVDYFTRIFSHR